MKVKAIEDTSQFEFTTTINIATDSNECLSGKYNENGDLISPNGDISFETTLHNGYEITGKIKLFHKSKLSDKEGKPYLNFNLSCSRVHMFTYCLLPSDYLEIILTTDGGDIKRLMLPQ